MLNDDRPLCIVPPRGLQALLMTAGLVRHAAETARGDVYLLTEVEHLRTLPRLFGDVPLRFWFDSSVVDARAARGELNVVHVPHDVPRAYALFGLKPIDMHELCVLSRDSARERAVLHGVVSCTGPTYVVVQGISHAHPALPEGLPLVDVDDLQVREPLDLCMVLENAMQVHARDGWLLTLSDMLGGPGAKFCHTDPAHAAQCRRRYRRRVTVLP